MTILASEIKFFKSMVVSDDATNGGYRSDNQITSGSPANVFPNVFSAERNAGSDKHRFVYIANHNANREEALNLKMWLDKETPAGDYVQFFMGTQGMTQGDIVGTEEKFTVATLTTNIAVGGNTFVGTFPVAGLTGSIVNGSKIRLTNKATPDAVTGTEEFVTVNSVPSIAGTQTSFTFTPVTAYAYTVAEGSRCSKVSEVASLKATQGTITKSSAAGTFDDSTYPPLLDNIGTIQDTFTFTFSNATNFTCVSARYGSLGAGVTTSNFAPNNPRCSRPYFTIELEFWGGTWALNDTLTLPTHEASICIGENRVVPAGCSSFVNNSFTLAVSLETA